MPRKPAAAKAAAKPEVNAAAVSGDLISLDKLAAHRTEVVTRVSKEFGLTLPPFDLDRYAEQINFLSASVADGLLRQGVWLIAMKEALPHGEFERELTSRTGISARGARVIMQATRRFATDAGKKFLANAQHDGQVTKTRLLELAINMDEAELEVLADGGEVKGHSKEEYLKMTRSELLAALSEKDTAILRGKSQLTKLEDKLEAKEAAERKEDPNEALLRKFESALVELAGDVHKTLVKDLKDTFTNFDKQEWKKADAEQADALDARASTAKFNAIAKAVNACRLVAIAAGIELAELGLTDDDAMPRDFQ